MSIIALDLGGTKVASAVFSPEGSLLARRVALLHGRGGDEVASLMVDEVAALRALPEGRDVDTVGVSVPGIYNARQRTVWAPNLPGWEAYPLLEDLAARTGLPVTIDSDRACSILGETWCGRAKACRHAIFVAVGTGIGAGILVDGVILRGRGDVAGATGWLALDRPYLPEYAGCGCFEYHASGAGLVKAARRLLAEHPAYSGPLRRIPEDALRAEDIFAAEASGDALAGPIIESAIGYWGMAVANYVSLFNPEMIIFGGGVFGPAARFLDRIYEEARKWAQPISIRQVELVASSLGPDAALYGAARIALDASEP